MGMDGLAYWYKHGKVIEVQNSLHIKDIIENPKTFDMTKEHIEEIYKKYNEKMGFEGKAREELMVEAMDKGWIRVRQSTTRQGVIWTVQFKDFAKQNKDLKGLVEYLLLDKKVMKKHDTLYLLSYDGKTREQYNDFYGRNIMTFLESLKKEKKVIVEAVNKYKYFDY